MLRCCRGYVGCLTSFKMVLFPTIPKEEIVNLLLFIKRNKKRKKELYLKERDRVCDFQRTANCIFPLKGRGGKAQQDLGPLCRSSFSRQVPVAQRAESTIHWILQYSRFSHDVTAAMLVYRTVAKKVFWGWFYYYAKLERHFAIDLYTNMAVSSRQWKPRIDFNSTYPVDRDLSA